MIAFRRLVLPLVALPLLQGCPYPPLPDPDIREYTGFHKEAKSKFLGLPLERQYEFYLYAKHYIRPGPLMSGSYLASHGESIMPFLRTKFSEAKSAETQEDVMFILAVMTAEKHYDVGREAELVAQMRKAVEAMKRGRVQDAAMRDYGFIVCRSTNDYVEWSWIVKTCEDPKLWYF